MDQQLLRVESKHQKASIPELRPGQTIRVHQKIVEAGKERIAHFEGVVIAVKHGRGLSGSFTVRRIAAHVGVERVFPLHLPSIVKIETLKSSPVRRAKLYYTRALSGRALRRKGDQKLTGIWEDLKAREELDRIEAEKAEQAKEKEAQRDALEAEREAKVEAALKTRTEPTADQEQPA